MRTARELAHDAFELVMRPRQFVAHQPIDRRAKFQALLRTLKGRDYRARDAALAALRPDKPLRAIEDPIGFRWLDDADKALVTAARDAALSFRDTLDLDVIVSKSPNKPHVTIPIPLGAHQNRAILDLIVHPAMVKMAGDYIGTLPLLMDAYLMYSPNSKDIPGTSQQHHFDGQDVRTILVYLFLCDVDADGGPFVALTAGASERIARAVRYRKIGPNKRLTDDVVDPLIHPSEKHTFTGSAGSMLACDTDRCFHYGSRNAKRPRHMLLFHYVSPACFQIPWRYNKVLPQSSAAELPHLTQWQRMVLGG